jgi:hypothetical protein
MKLKITKKELLNFLEYLLEKYEDEGVDGSEFIVRRMIKYHIELRNFDTTTIEEKASLDLTINSLRSYLKHMKDFERA